MKGKLVAFVWIAGMVLVSTSMSVSAAAEVESELLNLRALIEAQRADIDTLQQALTTQQHLLDQQGIAIAALGGTSSELEQVAAIPMEAPEPAGAPRACGKAAQRSTRGSTRGNGG